MTQYQKIKSKKEVVFDSLAFKEFEKLPHKVKLKFRVYIAVLSEKGYLTAPDARKLSGLDLFEIRVKMQGVWRCFYAYISGNRIVLLRFFKKKMMKTPRRELNLAASRLQKYAL